MRILYNAVAFIALTSFLQAADEPRWRTLHTAARRALQSNDYASLRSILEELRPLEPGNARNAYNWAAVNAKLGNRQEALRAAAQVAAMGLAFDLKADPDFASLLGTSEFEAILKQAERNRRPVQTARLAWKLALPDVLPEDLAFDPKTRRFFVASVRRARVFTATGEEFATLRWPAAALRTDAKRRSLWVAESWMEHCDQCDAADRDKSALVELDLDSGKRKRLVPSAVAAAFGDMTISRSGDLYVSDGRGAVFRLPAGSDVLERLDQPGEFASPQTPALSADEQTLFIPDYIRGIAAMDLRSRQVRWLQPAGSVAVSGIDGLYFHSGSLIAIQNGVQPARLVRFSLDLQKQQILEAGTPGLGEPTHGVLVGDDFYFLANTGWNEYDAKGRKKAGSAPVLSEVWRLRLK